MLLCIHVTPITILGNSINTLKKEKTYFWIKYLKVFKAIHYHDNIYTSG